MNAHTYTEDQQAQRTLTRPLPEEEEVEQPATGLFAELGWTTVAVLEEVFGRSRDEAHPSSTESQSLLTSSPTVCLGRETKGEVVLVSRLRAALERLNPALPPAAITAASISGKGRVSPHGENPVFNETPVLKGGLGLIEWLTACCCISLIAKRFLFEWKTSL